MTRRYFRIHAYLWDPGKPTELTGVMLHAGAGSVFLTPEQAFAVANQIVDLAETLTEKQEANSAAP
ncbi:hypothetical protein SB659_07690 [Arthrobacter sp. SIMBA_036]|uniref:hypothetical protein n=1 Tax=Arthrobacter sp. SIMBA_036 TaxID=3085778 RepID=UPI00397A8544